MRDLIFNPLVLILLSCTGLIYLYLLVKTAQNKNASTVLSQFSVTFLFISTMGITLPIFSNLAPYALTGIDKSIESAVFQLLIYAGLIYLLKEKSVSSFKFIIRSYVRYKTITLLLIISVLSSFWSETPLFTLRSSLVLVGVSTFAIYLATHLPFARVDKIVRWSNTFIIILSVIFSHLTPYDAEGRWAGLVGHSIPFGAMAAFNSVLWIFFGLTHTFYQRTAFAIAIISVGVMVFAGSATGFTIFLGLLGVILCFLCLKHVEDKYSMVILVLFIILLVLVHQLLTFGLEAMFQAVGRDPTLTGRTDFWSQLITKILDHPFGYGINGFWQPWRGFNNPAKSIFNPNGYTPPHAHNGYLEIGLQLGLLGIVLFAISVMSNFINLTKLWLSKANTEFIFSFLFLGYILLINISHNTILDTSYVWIMYIFTTIKLDYSVRKKLSK